MTEASYIAARAQSERRHEIALQDVMNAARYSNAPERVLAEALHRVLKCEDLSKVLDTILAIYRVEPNGVEDQCPHYDAKAELARAADDLVTYYEELQEAKAPRISGDPATGIFAAFKSCRVNSGAMARAAE